MERFLDHVSHFALKDAGCIPAERLNELFRAAVHEQIYHLYFNPLSSKIYGNEDIVASFRLWSKVYATAADLFEKHRSLSEACAELEVAEIEL